MTGKQLLAHLNELTPSQLKLPVRIEMEFNYPSDGSDNYIDIEEPATSCDWTDKAIIIKAK